MLYVPRAARIHMTELTLTADRVIRERIETDARCQRIGIFSLEGELFFGSAPDLERHFEHIGERGLRVVVLRFKRVRNPDAVCLESLDRFLDKMAGQQVKVILCGVRRDLGKVLRASGIEKKIGLPSIFYEKPGQFSSTLDAVRHAYDLLKDDYCADCPRKQEAAREVLYYMI